MTITFVGNWIFRCEGVSRGSILECLGIFQYSRCNAFVVARSNYGKLYACFVCGMIHAGEPLVRSVGPVVAKEGTFIEFVFSR
jgi:hypothetical protein